MDKKYKSRFFDFFFDFDFNHDFDTNRHALSHILLVFAHLTCLAHLVLHFSLFYYTFYSLFLFFTYIYIYIYIGKKNIYIYMYMWVIKSNKTRCNQSMWAKRNGSIFRFVCVRSAQSFTAKANAPLMIRSRSPVNRIPLKSRAHIKCFQ